MIWARARRRPPRSSPRRAITASRALAVPTNQRRATTRRRLDGPGQRRAPPLYPRAARHRHARPRWTATPAPHLLVVTLAHDERTAAPLPPPPAFARARRGQGTAPLQPPIPSDWDGTSTRRRAVHNLAAAGALPPGRDDRPGGSRLCQDPRKSPTIWEFRGWNFGRTRALKLPR